MINPDTISRDLIKESIDDIPESRLQSLYAFIQTLVIEPKTATETVDERAEWLAFLDKTYGSLSSDVKRHPQGEYEIREPID